MKSPLSRDIPKGAAAAIVALALLAGVVTGREPPGAPERAVPAKAPPGEAAPVEAFDLKLISRLRSEREFQDLFAPPAPKLASAPPSPAPTPAAQAKPVSPPVPQAPALPFTYLGRMTKGDQVIVYLLRNQEMHLAEVGSTLDAHYRIESISDSAVRILYLPLGTTQQLAIPATP